MAKCIDLLQRIQLLPIVFLIYSIAFVESYALATESNEKVREYVSMSCIDAVTATRCQEREACRESKFSETYKGKWVKWAGRIATVEKTLWGVEVAVKCHPTSTKTNVTLSIESLPKSTLSSLSEGQQIQFTGQIDGIDELSGIIVRGAEFDLEKPEGAKEEQKVAKTFKGSTGIAKSDSPLSKGSNTPEGSLGRSRTWHEPLTGIEFVWVPGGCFQMGCGTWTSDCDNDEFPVHDACVRSFWIGKYEVTQSQWQRIMITSPSSRGLGKEGPDYPAVAVSRNQIGELLERLNKLCGGRYRFRLPTEAEWEYACRSGGRPEKYSGGSELDRYAWHSDNSGGSTHAVGMKTANGLGIHDMSGNASEFVEDNYSAHGYEQKEINNPVLRTNEDNCVIRGGAVSAKNSTSCRCSNRFGVSGKNSYGPFGFRIVREE